MRISEVLAGKAIPGVITIKHGLETVASRYLNEAVDKSERLSNWNFELSEAQLEYAARDAAVAAARPPLNFNGEGVSG